MKMLKSCLTKQGCELNGKEQRTELEKAQSLGIHILPYETLKQRLSAKRSMIPEAGRRGTAPPQPRTAASHGRGINF